LVAGMVLIKMTLARVGQLDMRIIMSATFAPLWLGAAIGLAVAYGRLKSESPAPRWLATLLAGLLAIPVAFLEPWVILALGLGSKAAVFVLRLNAGVVLLLELMLLSLPIACAMLLSFLASPVSMSEPRGRIMKNLDFRRAAAVLVGLAVVAALNFFSYYIIYSLLLPPQNFLGIPG